MLSTLFPRLAIMAALGTVLCSCDRKQRFGIAYDESSHEERVAETTAVFAGGSEADGIEPFIDSFFTRMGRASRSEDEIDVFDFISVDAMLETAEDAGAFQGLNMVEKMNFRRGFRQGLAGVDQSIRQMGYDRHRIAKVEKPHENRRIVYVSLYDNELSITTQMRWWLVRTDDGWRAHDYEDLTVGLRTVGLIATLMKAGLGDKADPWIADFIPVVSSMQSIDLSDPEAMVTLRDPMIRLLEHDLPLDIRRFANTILASIRMMEGEVEQARELLEAAEKGGYDSPLADYQIGYMMMNREDWEEALASFEKHISIFGSDFDVLEAVSDCHYRLGHLELAREAALRGLDDNPQSVNCLASLVAASTPEQLGGAALAARFEASGNAAEAYETALDYLVSLDAMDHARVLFAACRGKFEDPELVEYYEETLAGDADATE